MVNEDGMDSLGLSAYDRLHPEVRRWVWLQGWQRLRPIQAHAIAPILSGDRDVVIGAPTAGGKTEAAFLPILSKLMDDVDAKASPEGYQVLVISPLKALINDQYRRLSEMCAGLGIEVTPWHGDVSASRKRGSLSKPRGILLITPESLESLMVNKPHALEQALRGLRYVVVDELHAFMGSERGVQLQSLLSRIEHSIGRQVPRVALSATFADPHQPADFLRPGRGAYPVEVPSPGDAGHDTLILVKEFVSDGEEQYDEAVARDVYKNLRGSNNLVFANSRKEAEGLALKLKDMSQKLGVPNEFRLHHGSLSKGEREDVERSLKEGNVPTTAICTSTLELGIDIGSVESIAQLTTANSVSALRQRLGRSGRRGTPSILRVYSLDEERDDYKYHLRTSLVQNIAVIELMRQGRYERVNTSVPHYSTLIQQTLSLTAQYGSFYPADAYRLLCSEGAFGNVTPDDYVSLLRSMASHGLISQMPSGLITVGSEGERLMRNKDFYTAFLTLKDLSVRDLSTDRLVGAVQYKPYVGEYILLGAQRWLVERVDERRGEIGVNPVRTTGKMMFEGYGQEVDAIIPGMMRQIYESDADYPYLDDAAREALRQARAFYRETLSAGDAKAHQVLHTDAQDVLFTWGGMRLNHTLALLYRADGHPMPHYDAYAVTGVPPDYLERLSEADLEHLASLVPRHRRETDRYDHYLPDELLNKKYAAQALARG